MAEKEKSEETPIDVKITIDVKKGVIQEPVVEPENKLTINHVITILNAAAQSIVNKPYKKGD